MKKTHLWILVLSLVALIGCNKTQQAEAGSKAHEAGESIKQGAQTAEKRLSDAGVTLKVKSAMNSSDKLDTSGINIDTRDRVVHLKGLVTSQDQKALAERIARDTVGNDIKVISELAIRPKPVAQEVK